MATVNEEIKIGKHMCKIFINTGTKEEKKWSQVDKSTVLNIAMNPETETQDWISMELPVEEVKQYKPTLDEEIATIRNNPIYEFMFDRFYNCKVGDVESLICFPPRGPEGVQSAWMVENTALILNNADYVEGKLHWTMNFGGNIGRGTYTIDGTTGAPSYVPPAQS